MVTAALDDMILVSSLLMDKLHTTSDRGPVARNMRGEASRKNRIIIWTQFSSLKQPFEGSPREVLECLLSQFPSAQTDSDLARQIMMFVYTRSTSHVQVERNGYLHRLTRLFLVSLEAVPT